MEQSAAPKVYMHDPQISLVVPLILFIDLLMVSCCLETLVGGPRMQIH
jgi:hypothetical protein